MLRMLDRKGVARFKVSVGEDGQAEVAIEAEAEKHPEVEA